MKNVWKYEEENMTFKSYLLKSIGKEIMSLNSAMRKIGLFIKKNVWKLCFVIGMGGVVSIAFLLHISIHSSEIGTVLHEKINNISASNMTSSVVITPLLLAFVAGASFVLLLFAILGNTRSPRAGLKGLVTFVCIVLISSGYVTFSLSGNYGIFFVFMTWACFSWFVWVSLEVLEALKAWSLITEDKTQSYDPVKLSLLWAIAAFILGKII